MIKNQKTYSDEEFTQAVKESPSIASTLLKLKLKPAGSNYSMFYRETKRLNLSYDHFGGQAWNLGKENKTSILIKTKKPIEDFLVNDPTATTNTRCLKDRLIKEKFLINECSICKINSWQGKKLVLHMDHIDGVNTNNAIENLRLLCPNCHSQTDTYTGRNIKNKYLTNKCKNCDNLISKKRAYCKDCFLNKQYQSNNNVSNHTFNQDYTCTRCTKTHKEKSLLCRSCRSNKDTKTKITWPDKETLKTLVWEKSCEQLSKELGVSGKAIEKRCKKFGIEKPPRGYWAKQHK